jgi:hypothetical protein
MQNRNRVRKVQEKTGTCVVKREKCGNQQKKEINLNSEA